MARPRKKPMRPPPRAAARTTLSEAERRLLALAQTLGAAADDPDVLSAALRILTSQYSAAAALPRAMCGAWLGSRKDKTAALALAWAREQVRLSLRDVLERAPARGALAMDADTLAWLLLAACEALAYEPDSAVADRVRVLFEITGAAAPAVPSSAPA
ncbi:MAG: hypothetical protein WED01_14000 [Candidatus Rokuibacteriota bacterium]